MELSGSNAFDTKQPIYLDDRSSKVDVNPRFTLIPTSTPNVFSVLVTPSGLRQTTPNIQPTQSMVTFAQAMPERTNGQLLSTSVDVSKSSCQQSTHASAISCCTSHVDGQGQYAYFMDTL